MVSTLHLSDNSSANVTNQSAWSSSIRIRASVNSSGLASALLSGLVTLTARLGNLTATSQLNIVGNERISLEMASGWPFQPRPAQSSPATPMGSRTYS